MSRTGRFFYNSIASAALQIVTMIAGFIVPRYMLTCYGSEINGLLTSVTQFVGYFNLVEAGLASAAVCSLYKPLAEKNNHGVNAILSAARRLYNQTGYFFVSLVLGLAIIYPVFIKSDSVGLIEVGVLVLVIGCSGALEFFTMSKYRVLLTADQKIYVLSIASICSIVLSTIIIAILAEQRVNIVVLRAAALSAVFLRSIILCFYVKYTYKNVDYHTAPDNVALNKRWDALYLQILGGVQSGAPIIIATIFTTLKEVSIYAIYNIVLGGIAGIFSVAISGLFASFGDVIAKGELRTLQKAYQEFELVYYMLITWVYSCAMILIMPFIKLYTQGVTDANYDVPVIGALFILSGLLHHIKTPQGTLVLSAGLFKETRIQTSIQGLIAVIGGVILVQYWGLAGILMAVIFSSIYRDIDLLFFIPKHVTKLNVKLSFFRIVVIFACFGMTQIPFIFINIDVANYAQWIKYALFVGTYVFAVVVAINFICDKAVLTAAMRRLAVVFTK